MEQQLIHFSETLISDMHKDAYGFRPRSGYQEWFTKEQLDATYDDLQRGVDASIREDARREESNWQSFNARVEAVQAAGAGTRANALRWMMQAEGQDIQEACERDYFAFDVVFSCGDRYLQLCRELEQAAEALQ